MRYALLVKFRNWLLLTARVLRVVLFVKVGLAKAVSVAETSAYMASTDLPVPSLMSLIAGAIELGVGLAFAIGFYTRPLALLLGIYTLIAAVISHPYWHMSGELQNESMINFYKNISIAGGLLLLVLTGPGAYSLDRK